MSDRALWIDGPGAGMSVWDQPPVPVIADIHVAVYDAASRPDALRIERYHHKNGVAHCRIGWITTLAGDAGKALEAFWGAEHAAWLIYKASDPDIIGRPNMFLPEAAQLADMKRLAAVQALVDVPDPTDTKDATSDLCWNQAWQVPASP